MLRSKKSYFIPIIGFAVIMLVGAWLLCLPICNNMPINFEKALFASISGVTTTGIVKVNLVQQFTIYGQIVIAILMELGTMGFLVFVSFFWIITNKKIKISDMITINESISGDNLGLFKEYSLFVFKLMIRIQIIGTILYSIKFVPEFGLVKGIWYSVFHAISAFANSGYDILGNKSFCLYSNDIYMQIITILIMLTGSVGILTMGDIAYNRKRHFKHLKAQTKIILIGTAIIVVIPTIILKMHEPNISALNALYTIVASRSTGFYVVDMKTFSPESLLLLMVVMFVGGAPSSTAGGVKLLAISIIIATIISTIKGNDETVIFWRKIPDIIVRRSFVILFLFLTILFIAGMILYFNSDMSLIEIAFDSISCLTNTGYSLANYSSSNMTTDCVMMALMFIGQVGPLSMVLAFVRSANRQKYIKYAEENIILW